MFSINLMTQKITFDLKNYLNLQVWKCRCYLTSKAYFTVHWFKYNVYFCPMKHPNLSSSVLSIYLCINMPLFWVSEHSGLWQRHSQWGKCVCKKASKANLLQSFWHSISAQKNTSSTSSSSSIFLSTIISGKGDCHKLPPPRVRCNLVWAYFMQIQFLFQKRRAGLSGASA